MPFQKGNTEQQTHGCSKKGQKTAEYRAWEAMRRRCFNSSQDNYARYGGKGITVCDRWRHSFVAFLSDMGMKPSPDYSLDRILSNGNYEPANCRWATRSEQMRNRKPLRRDWHGRVMPKEN